MTLNGTASEEINVNGTERLVSNNSAGLLLRPYFIVDIRSTRYIYLLFALRLQHLPFASILYTYIVFHHREAWWPELVEDI